MAHTLSRPSASEYNPYFEHYISLVPDGDFAEIVRHETDRATRVFMSIPEPLHNYSYAEGKWTIKQVLQHIIDTERVMSYRAMVAARGDSKTEIAPMDENLYAANADVSHKSMQTLLAEFVAVRSAAAILFMSLSDAELLRTCKVAGIHNTARAWAFITVGHTMHHLQVLGQRYLELYNAD